MTNVPPPPPPPPPGAGSARPENRPPPPVGTIRPDSVIVLKEVSKWFGDLVAVNQVSFGVPPGVTALLGPNGAGKSTVLRLLCGLAPPSQGSVAVLGADPRTDLAVRGQIGLAPQQESMFEVHDALEFVRLSALMSGVDDPGPAARGALETVELDPDDTRKLATYSKGMRQRVKLAQAIVHKPKVLLLDEPLSGLDPRQRARMIDLVHAEGERGTCVLISSHVLEEVERFGSRVLVMVQGRLAAEGDFRAIRDLMDDQPHRIRVETDRPRDLAADLVSEGIALGVHLETQGGFEVETREVRQFRQRIARLARSRGASLTEVRPLDDDLESVFRYVVGS